MKGKDYYQNKIMYALSKIDYAQSKIANKKDIQKPLSKIYNAFLLYGSQIKLQQLIKVTNLKRDDIIPHLKTLKELGLVAWDGTYLSETKFVEEQQRATKPGFQEWYKNFMIEYEKKYSDKVELEEVVAVFSDQEYVEIPLKNGAILKVPKQKVIEAFIQ